LLSRTTALVVAALLLLLYFYRRRPFILYWIAAWILLASSMFLTVRLYSDTPLGRMAFGISQFLTLIGSLSFVVAADAYRHRPRMARGYSLLLLPVVIWFSLASVALTVRSVFTPRYVCVWSAWYALVGCRLRTL